MSIELTPPTIYATPGELADAYMSEVEKAWRNRPAFALEVVLDLPEQIIERQDVVAFWGQVQKRLPEGWRLYALTAEGRVALNYRKTQREWPDHDAWAV